MNTLSNVKTEEAAECISSEAFRNGMACLPGAVNIVTTHLDENRAGFTATAVCSVSDNPPTLLVCLNRGASVHQVFSQATTLVINTLGAGQDKLSNLFGGKAPMLERFAEGKWDTLVTGSPVLAGAAVSFDCKIISKQSVATHDVFFCEVLSVKQNDQAGALLYFQRAYHHIDHKA
jgi:flavin reductase